MPASSECNWQVKLKILKKDTRINSLKARSIPIGTSVCLSKGEVHVQILQDQVGEEEERGRHSFNCSTSVLVGKSLVSNGHSVWHRSSALTFLSRTCSSGVGEASVCACVGCRQGSEEGARVSPWWPVPGDWWGGRKVHSGGNRFFKCSRRRWLHSTKVGQVGGRGMAVRSCE